MSRQIIDYTGLNDPLPSGWKKANENFAELYTGLNTVSGNSATIYPHKFATGGAGTSGDPWLGWDTGVTWGPFTRYEFKSGYYEYQTSPNFGYYGIELVGEPGTYLRHNPGPPPSGSRCKDAFVMDAGGYETFTVVIATDNTLNVPAGNGFRNGTPVKVSNTGGALPTPLSAVTTYYVINLNAAGTKFELTTVAGSSGNIVTLTGNGTGTHKVISTVWFQNVRVENINVIGKAVPITGALTLVAVSVTVNDSTDVWTAASGHGFSNGTAIYLSGGFPEMFYQYGSGRKLLPNVPYYVINLSGNTFQLSETVGGAAINARSAVTGTVIATAGVITGTNLDTQCPVGTAITFAGGGATARTYVVTSVISSSEVRISQSVVQAEAGNAATACYTRNGFFLRALRNGAFDRLSAKDIGYSALWSEACVTNSLRLFRSSYHEPEQNSNFQVRPQFGIVTYTRGAAYPSITDWSTCWNIEEPVIEGVQQAGIWFTASSYGNTVTNGTSEGNPITAIGMLVDGNHNDIRSIDIEGNESSLDLVVRGSFNKIFSLPCQSTTIIQSLATPITLNGSHNYFLGNIFHTFYIVDGYYNKWLGGKTNQFYDAGTATIKLTAGDNSDIPSFISKLGVVQKMWTDYGNPASITVDATTTNMATSLSYSTPFVVNNPTNAFNGAEITYTFYNLQNNSPAPIGITWGNQFAPAPDFPLPSQVGSYYDSPSFKGVTVSFRYTSTLGYWVCTSVYGAPAVLPQRILTTGTYTGTFSDAGRHILHPSAQTGAMTYVIPPNSNISGVASGVAFPIGTTLTFVNEESAGVLTLDIVSGDQLWLAGVGNTAPYDLAPNGIATALKITSTRWMVNGVGLS